MCIVTRITPARNMFLVRIGGGAALAAHPHKLARALASHYPRLRMSLGLYLAPRGEITFHIEGPWG